MMVRIEQGIDAAEQKQGGALEIRLVENKGAMRFFGGPTDQFTSGGKGVMIS